MTATIPFSQRTTSAVDVFVCIFAAHDAMALTAIPSQIGALQVEYAALLSLYRQICHQDVANEAAVLAGVIAQIATALGNLNATVQAITPTAQNGVALAKVQTVVANAVASVAKVQAAAPSN